MKRKGFTLIELMAVIVILAFIAALTIPQIVQTVRKSELDSIKSTAHLLAKAAQDYYADQIIESKQIDRLNLADDTLVYNGDRPEEGYAFFDDEGRAYIRMYYKGRCVSRYQDGRIDMVEVPLSGCKVANIVVVTLYPDGGTLSVGDQWSMGEGYASTSVEISTKLSQLPKIERTGYTFNGWYDTGNRAVNIYAPVLENYTLTAKWQPNTYIVTVDPNGSDVSNLDGWRLVNGVYQKYVTYDQEYGSLLELSKTGHSFHGYKNSEGQIVRNDTILKDANDHSLTPIWDSKIYQLTLVYNDGVTPNEVIDVEYNTVYGGLPQLERDGYVFKGWYTDPVAGTEVTADTVVATPSNHSIYARWEIRVFTVTLNANGGTMSSTNGWTGSGTTVTKKLSYGDLYGTMPEPLRTGYTFKGWYTQNGLKVSANSNVAIDKDHVVYAQWTAKSYTVTFVTENKNMYGDGTSIYFNPTSGAACKETQAVSTYGTKSGCMRWYLFLDSESASTVNLILDHNTTNNVAWNSKLSATTPSEIMTQLANDTNGWKQVVSGTTTTLAARLISSIELNQMTSIAEIDTTVGFWTSTYSGDVTSNTAWALGTNGLLVNATINDNTIYGVRPVISISKSLVRSQLNAKTVTYNKAYGTLPIPVKEGYTFQGWYTAQSGGTRIDSNSIVNITSNISLYAQWK